jgi:glycosyltransferase involved in cell wall biosynthesis
MLLVHDSIDSLVWVVAISSLTTFLLILVASRYYGLLVDARHAVVDFVGLFKRIPPSAPLGGGKLRILIFNWRDLRHKWAGGAEVYLHELSKRWVAAGHRVTIFSGNDGHSARFERMDGVSVVRRGGFYLVYLWAFLYYFFRLRGRYDVIIDSENGLPFFTPFYVREPVFLLIHHVHQEVFRKSLIPPFSWIAQLLEKRFMPIVYRKIEVITVSPSSKAEIIEHKLTKKIPHIVYNGVNLASYKPGKKSSHPTILYLGRLTVAKSIHVLLHAVAQLQQDYPDLECRIAGDGPSRKLLEKLVAKLKIRNHVKFLGKVTEEEKIKLYREAWVFVNPSLIEGWGITTIEANACGTPVVASNVAGLRDAVSDTHSGILVPYGQADGFVLAISTILKDKHLRAKLSSGAIKWAQQYDWDKSASQVIRLMEKVYEK